eukprot:scaffold90050_cov43-Attheya_sp.AAC.2
MSCPMVETISSTTLFPGAAGAGDGAGGESMDGVLYERRRAAASVLTGCDDDDDNVGGGTAM